MDVFQDATISDVERIPSSQNGNPRYRILTDVGVFTTKTDAGVAYAISPTALQGRFVTLRLDARGQVIGLTER